MSKEQKALIRLKAQNPELKISLFREIFLYTLCSVFCVLSLLFTSSTSPAEEDQSDPGPQKVKQYRKVSITTGPDGKVSWLLGRNIGTAHGNAVVEYEDTVLKADHIWANLDTELIEAQGNVSLKIDDQIITAESMLFDLREKKGIMKDGVSFDEPWYHAGEKMSRFSAEKSLIENGSMTSCSLDHPHYIFEASQIVVHLKKELIAKHVVFKIGGIPLLYLPIYRRSLEPDKRARFVFKIGSNSFEGYYVKNILPIHWRMIDGGIFFNYTSRRGRTGGTEFKYDADKVKLREIFLPVPENATSKERADIKKKADDLLQRAEGGMDRIWLKQIFIRFQIEEGDKAKAREKAEEVLKKCKEKDADFYRLARQWSDDEETASRGGSLGYFVMDENGVHQKEGAELAPVKPSLRPIIEEAFKLESEGLSDLIETEEGYHIVKIGTKDREEVQVRHIFVMFEPTKSAQEAAEKEADNVLTELFGGAEFDEMAKLHSDDTESRDKGGDLGWQTFQDLEISFRSIIRSLNKGEVSPKTVTARRGIYIVKLEDKEETPDFADLAREHSQSSNAEAGGDTGYKGRWEFSPEVAREAFRLDIGDISKPIKTDDGYRIVKVEKKRQLGGDASVELGDLYSYKREKNPVKIGQTWNVDVHHKQTLWRGGQRWGENTITGQMGMKMEKALSMRAQLSLAGKEYKQVYQSYTPERELRSYCAFDYYWMSEAGSSGRTQLIVDGTRDLLGEDTGLKQKYPEITFQPPSYQLHRIQPFKKINSGLLYVSDSIQGKAAFADLARQFSDDPRTKEKGGDMGWLFSQDNVLNPKVKSKVFDTERLAPGEISEPIAVAEGFYIVKIEEAEEKSGERERARVRDIFIAIEPGTRTEDEARALAKEIYRKIAEGDRPSLGFLTLNDTSLSFSIDAGNYYKDKYLDETDIWVQTAYGSASLSKRALIKLGVTRELNLTVSGKYSQSWHSKTQPLRNSLSYGGELEPTEDPNRRDWNVFTSAWSATASLSTNLHRIYRTTYIPGVYAMRHTISPNVSFSYEPPGESEIRAGELKPMIYTFAGRASLSYERKQLSVGMTNTIDIKTERTRERISLLKWNLSGGADYTEPADSETRYEFIQNTFALTPSKQISIGTVIKHNPNNFGTDKPLLSSFNSDIRYSDSRNRWMLYLSRQYSRDRWSTERQYFLGKVDLRWSRNWNLSCELEYEYDDQVKDIYSTRVSLHRMLHCWESRIGYSRYGTKGRNIRKDFYFQIDLLADPGKALGVGYDDIDKSWSLRSLPGMGKLGGFLRPQSELYY